MLIRTYQAVHEGRLLHETREAAGGFSDSSTGKKFGKESYTQTSLVKITSP